MCFIDLSSGFWLLYSDRRSFFTIPVSTFRRMKDLVHVSSFSKSMAVSGKFSVVSVWFYADPRSSILTLAASCCGAFACVILGLNQCNLLLLVFSTST